ncbi:bifunctional diaminohydroxyphosphoribosylaminopyrimidine deaminase/5-amino-6-(5-phosphoribosylamino)uracil reductase RibD [Limibacterium fermenti]|uniref:bifunctional diaminohydroxyphosphoribosylaminopyrimidine deaminase/5-amino-6-(5-phosphoribosylamino)uracil reductase RibD n=1 Tax=Limibacterium fermenti TaxID=3229863 RepID=UPI000E965833|nr:bifunctional diaminohydroxyphosphoribosylaminopyrimidine deaminase/5-amino-6-(5-phosphoribosylamino)uracil reductase RibD [Porphyromonadaceae bacterium]
MGIDEKYMFRCLQLAKKGEGYTRPNPMVGAVIVHNGKIIGEGYHRKYGEPHAEVNAVRSVKDPSLLPQSTLYVSLEPCSHYGKTPPCSAMIISHKIPRVVIAVTDPNPKVAGNGIRMLRENGVDVTVGILEKEARELNRSFFVNQLYCRPYIILKWAQSKDGYLDRHRTSHESAPPAMLSNTLTSILVHRTRTQVQGIMVGTRTALLDNPQLTARKWYGSNPVRIIIDRENKIPADFRIFRPDAPTLVFTEKAPPLSPDNKFVKYIELDFSKDILIPLLKAIYKENIYSVLVEGGGHLLSSFIEKQLWDEAFIEITDTALQDGIKSPEIQGQDIDIQKYSGSVQIHLKSKITRNFL